MDNAREMTYGEKAVGLSFNPSGDPAVHNCKTKFAALIDDMNELRNTAISNGHLGGEVIRMTSVAITELQTAQMWAVKALTWRV